MTDTLATLKAEWEQAWKPEYDETASPSSAQYDLAAYAPFVQKCFTCRGATYITNGASPTNWEIVCPGCLKRICDGSSSGCPLPANPRITA
jgi:hypothetical protein